MCDKSKFLFYYKCRNILKNQYLFKITIDIIQKMWYYVIKENEEIKIFKLYLPWTGQRIAQCK